MARRLRVLALHSFRTSAVIFQQQLARSKLVDALKDIVDFVFINAPHPASGSLPPDVAPFFPEGPHYEWFTADKVDGKLVVDEQKLVVSLEHIRLAVQEQGPFDGLIGFSQGSICAATVVALQQAGKLEGMPLFKFVILNAGMKTSYQPHLDVFHNLGKMTCPSLHMFGEKDELKKYSLELSFCFDNPVILTHPRGHVIAQLPPHQVAVVRAFISSFAAVEVVSKL